MLQLLIDFQHLILSIFPFLKGAEIIFLLPSLIILRITIFPIFFMADLMAIEAPIISDKILGVFMFYTSLIFYLVIFYFIFKKLFILIFKTPKRKKEIIFSIFKMDTVLIFFLIISFLFTSFLAFPVPFSELLFFAIFSLSWLIGHLFFKKYKKKFIIFIPIISIALTSLSQMTFVYFF